MTLEAAAGNRYRIPATLTIRSSRRNVDAEIAGRFFSTRRYALQRPALLPHRMASTGHPTPDTDDVLVLGAGAAGLMCAAVAGQRGRRVRVLERAERIGKKILISGGGRCNFTNLHAGPENYLSEQPDFCRSALARYRPADFVALVERHGIAYHEKKLGQLFCDGSSREIVAACSRPSARTRACGSRPACDVREVDADRRRGCSSCASAERELPRRVRWSWRRAGCLGPSSAAATSRYRLARQFGLRIVAAAPGAGAADVRRAKRGGSVRNLSGVSLPCAASGGRAARTFHENLLFTHRGLSGPAVLQISSYLPAAPSAGARFDLLPDARRRTPGSPASTRRATPRISPTCWPNACPRGRRRRFADRSTARRPLRQHALKALAALERTPAPLDARTRAGTEGYAKAEVTLGGVDTRDLHGKTMEARAVPGLYFIGEAVDVTGQLGGFNFQWAWASGHAAAMALTTPTRVVAVRNP